MTNVNTGVWQHVGKAEFRNTKFLYNANGNLYSIEKDGSLYEISQANGSWRRIGPKAAWANTIAGAAQNGKLYTVERTGALYKTNLSTGIWQQIGKAEFANTKFMFGSLEYIYH